MRHLVTDGGSGDEVSLLNLLDLFDEERLQLELLISFGQRVGISVERSGKRAA